MRCRSVGWAALFLVVTLLGAGCASVRHEPRPAETPKPSAEAATPTPLPTLERHLEPRAIDLLKATSDRLAKAGSMKFTAVVSYENPSLIGPPLIYTTKSEVAVKRPDKLRVLTSGDGPSSQFYYDGKTVTAFAPTENLVAVAEAPPTLDATLGAAYDRAATYFPFTDLIVADPYGDIADGIWRAFYIGQSNIVGGTTTDMVAYVDDNVFVQAWIGVKDKLPRMLRAVYRDDPAWLRHQLEISNWQLDVAIPDRTFAAPGAAARAKRIPFESPDPIPSPSAEPAANEVPAETQ
jgi:hypothetical protein